VKKKTREWKGGLMETVRAAADDHPRCVVFSWPPGGAAAANEGVRALREATAGTSRVVMAAGRVVRAALGRGEEDEYRPGSSRLGAALVGGPPAGLLFTRLSARAAAAAVAGVARSGWCRAGAEAPVTFTVPAGPVRLPDPDAPRPDGPADADADPPEAVAGPAPASALVDAPHTLEPQLRALGLPTRLARGKVECLADTVVCRRGKKLSADAAGLLRHFGWRLARFQPRAVATWEGDGGGLRVLDEAWAAAHPGLNGAGGGDEGGGG